MTMSTPNQIAANQRNAQKSTGPATPQGKETSSQNARTHGSTSDRVLPNEVASYEQFLTGFTQKYLPEAELERGHVRRLAELQVRIDRSLAAETAIMDQYIDMFRQSEGLSHEEALGRVFSDKECACQIRLVLRYQSQAMRLYNQTKKEHEDKIKARLIAAEAAAQLAAKSEARAAASGIKGKNGFVSSPVSAPAVNETPTPSRT